jgi:hypothetical protein
VASRSSPRARLLGGLSGLDEVEEPIPSRLDMGAVLYVVRRPKSLRSLVVSFIEQRIKYASSTIALFFSAFESLMVFLSCKSTLELQDATSIASTRVG